MGNQNYIVINGKKYDAVTGKMLQQDNVTPQPKKTISITPSQNVGVVDGFRRVSPKKQVQRAPAQHAKKSLSKSQTLARKAVAKPDAVHTPKQPEKPGILKSKLGLSYKRMSHAKQTPKHPNVQKYDASQARTSVVKKQLPLAVKPEPATPKAHSSSNTQQSAANATISHQSASHKIIEAALAQSTSHEQTTLPKKRKKSLAARLGISARVASISAGVLAVVLLAGFFTVQNIPNLSMRVVAARAGFDAKMPGYSPAGFSFKGPINYSPGRVVVSFKSNADDRQYDLIQQNSNWNSDALLANFIVEEDKTYQTYQDRGRTLYIYDGSNATWIDDGVWYQVEGNSNMSTDQLVKIAASI